MNHRAPPRVRGSMRSLLVIGLGAVLAACGSQPDVVAGSVVPVPTQEPRFGIGEQACPGALLEGTLVEHPVAGLAVQGDPLFEPSVVVWPHGWVAADVDGTRVLLDDEGRAVARLGDTVSAGGGFDSPNDWFHPCGEIRFIPPP